MSRRIDHIAIAVPDLKEALRIYQESFQGTASEPKELPDHGVRVAFLEYENTKIEFLEPLGDTSPLSNFLQRHPQGGLHHICFVEPDLAKTVASLQETGKEVLGDGESKIGAQGNPVLFLHPKDFCGVLVELEEKTPK
ncbi:MAG: methylmalonyl-CoA epimerase [Alphaproteobacteria bacterium]|jgi:methylmalonyl-CoA/ethylmalonyl-CoA epimerase|nr:methylmalonyl-CoA epimerase [Alphaproteobacteria bacterium]MBT5389428.1 methylmalonyl-CoA epimerase [Alphaproteobacteria bacterium]MBT5540516.1 methylmalonyl-CoA epimerase [Alphaproteobacteria bacterium]